MEKRKIPDETLYNNDQISSGGLVIGNTPKKKGGKVQTENPDGRKTKNITWVCKRRESEIIK